MRNLSRLFSVLLTICLLTGSINASSLASFINPNHPSISSHVMDAEALNVPGDVFLRPRSITTRTGLAVVGMALASPLIYEFITHPKWALLFSTGLSFFFASVISHPQFKDVPESRFAHIPGIPNEGLAQAHLKTEWNDVGRWLNAVVSRDGTKLAVASRGEPFLSTTADDVSYIVEYDRDPNSGELSHGEVIWRVDEHGEPERLGTGLYYTADDRITFISVVTREGRAEIPGSELTRPDYTAIYRIYQRETPSEPKSAFNPSFGFYKGVIRATDEMVGYANIAYRYGEWIPKIAPTHNRALLPILRWKEPKRTVSQEFLAEVPIDLERGQWNAKEWNIVLTGNQAIPGSAGQLLRLSDVDGSAAQYSYAKDGRSILLAQGGRFYEIKSSDPSGHFVQHLLTGDLLSHLVSSEHKNDGEIQPQSLAADIEERSTHEERVRQQDKKRLSDLLTNKLFGYAFTNDEFDRLLTIQKGGPSDPKSWLDWKGLTTPEVVERYITPNRPVVITPERFSAVLNDWHLLSRLQEYWPDTFGERDQDVKAWVYDYLSALRSDRWQWDTDPEKSVQLGKIFHQLIWERRRARDAQGVSKSNTSARESNVMYRILTKAPRFEMDYHFKHKQLSSWQQLAYPTSVLELGSRAYQTFESLNVYSLGDLIKKARLDLRLKNSGTRTIDEIERALASLPYPLYLAHTSRNNEEGMSTIELVFALAAALIGFSTVPHSATALPHSMTFFTSMLIRIAIGIGFYFEWNWRIKRKAYFRNLARTHQVQIKEIETIYNLRLSTMSSWLILIGGIFSVIGSTLIEQTMGVFLFYIGSYLQHRVLKMPPDQAAAPIQRSNNPLSEIRRETLRDALRHESSANIMGLVILEPHEDNLSSDDESPLNIMLVKSRAVTPLFFEQEDTSFILHVNELLWEASPRFVAPLVLNAEADPEGSSRSLDVIISMFFIPFHRQRNVHVLDAITLGTSVIHHFDVVARSQAQEEMIKELIMKRIEILSSGEGFGKAFENSSLDSSPAPQTWWSRLRLLRRSS